MTTSTEPTSNAQPQEFQAEIKQLLQIVINSLYTHREIFVRELVSNAADALEKFRHETLVNQNLVAADRALEIKIDLDEEKKTIAIADNGIGMTRDDLVQNLGTIAHSGTKAFLDRMAEGGAQKDLSLIGQFGVGFYSAFMVAQKVTVETRSSVSPDAKGYRWESEGLGTYTITEADGVEAGTRITLYLREDADEYSKDYQVRSIISRYSNFVPFPILLNGEKLNTVQAIWKRSKSELKDEDYAEFYNYLAGVDEPARFHLHFSADAPLAIDTLLYVPTDNIEALGFGRGKPGVDLYCRKVLIMKQPEDLLPEWMRFVRGVVDSEDLPLNISRETLQDNRLCQKLAKVITGRFIKFLAEQADKNAEAFGEFYKSHANFLKEGIVQDFAHRNDLAKLLRFESSVLEHGKTTSLADYVSRMKTDQKEIYYLNGSTREAIEAGPYLEAFKARGVEVLFTFDASDDFVMNSLGEFDGKRLVSADQGDIEIPGDAPETSAEPLGATELDELCGWLKERLGDRVGGVRGSKRLVDSPAAVTVSGGMSAAVQRLLMSGRGGGEGTPGALIGLELNPGHALVKKLAQLRVDQPELAGELGEQLFDNAMLGAGLLRDPRGMVQRMNRLLEKAAGL